jgi:hypothetical protein
VGMEGGTLVCGSKHPQLDAAQRRLSVFVIFNMVVISAFFLPKLTCHLADEVFGLNECNP